MTSKRLYAYSIITLSLDITGCHLVVIEKLLWHDVAYYLYCVSQAVTMWLLYYRISLQLQEHTMPFDSYLKRASFLFYIIVPFALKQILDEGIARDGGLDFLDYPLLLLTTIYAYHKYYKPMKWLVYFDKLRNKT